LGKLSTEGRVGQGGKVNRKQLWRHTKVKEQKASKQTALDAALTCGNNYSTKELKKECRKKLGEGNPKGFRKTRGRPERHSDS